MPDTWDCWPEILEQLKSTNTRATFDAVFVRSEAVLGNDKLVITAQSETAAVQMQNRLNDKIQAAIKAVVPDLGLDQIEIIYLWPDSPDLTTTLQTVGDYIDQRNKIIKPNQVEVHTQYFRRYWRPLLGPLLSELIRELRQRAYYGKGQDKFARCQVDATQPSLAKALGVSHRTIKRALRRNGQGSFDNPYLGFFILDMETVKKFDDEKRKFVNDHTCFTVALDEPLIPAHKGKPSKGHFVP